MEAQINKNKKRIIILGGGFAGIQTVLELCKIQLCKKSVDKTYEIILVSSHTVAVYNADLYEIATAYHKKITDQCLMDLKSTVAVPLSKILSGKYVTFLHDTTLKIFPEKNTIMLKNHGEMTYSLLVIAVGSVTNYYKIEGLEQFSYPLKTLQDAISISCHLDSNFQNLWKKETKKKIQIVIGGGGFTGIEFACELSGFIKKLCKKYQYPWSQVSLIIVEAKTALLAGQEPKMEKIIQQRLKKLNIQVKTGTKIEKVEAQKINTDKETMEMDMLIWTGGVKPNPLIRESFENIPQIKLAKNGALPVNEFLQNPDFKNIYAAGDCASYIDLKTQKPAPMLAQIAVQEGKVLAQNLLGKKTKYTPHISGIIIPLGGKYAVCKIGNIILKGFFAWAIKRINDLRYAMTIMPIWTAMKKWVHNTNIFMENDTAEN